MWVVLAFCRLDGLMNQVKADGTILSTGIVLCRIVGYIFRTGKEENIEQMLVVPHPHQP